MDDRKPAQPNGAHPTAVVRAIPLLTGFLSLTIYSLTLFPEVGPGDSAELALQAYQLGVTHPPGYPVHSLLGKLFTFVCAEPALATNLLSAVCAAVAVGLLSAIVLDLTGGWCAATFAPLLFAFTPRVWEAAITTEVYTINVCVLGLALMLLINWHRRPGSWMLWMSAGVLGISLGSSLANLILLPGFVLLVWRGRSARWLQVVMYMLIVAVMGSLVLSWTYFRARTVTPLGVAFAPDTLLKFLRYLTGAQYSAFALQPLGFYIHRFAEHGYYFGVMFLWLGIVLGILGIGFQWKQHRLICTALLVIFIANFGYFTGFPWTDYQQMVTPSYFVFSIWIGYGIEFVRRRRGRAFGTVASVIMPAVLVAGLLVSGLRAHNKRPSGTPITDFARSSLEVFPRKSVVFVEWIEFTPLLYFQQVHGLRPDVTILERAYGPRQYATGLVEDWHSFTYEADGSRPVVVDVIDMTAPPGYQFEPLGYGWYLVVRPHR
jgi:hypothetical protein